MKNKKNQKKFLFIFAKKKKTDENIFLSSVFFLLFV